MRYPRGVTRSSWLACIGLVLAGCSDDGTISANDTDTGSAGLPSSDSNSEDDEDESSASAGDPDSASASGTSGDAPTGGSSGGEGTGGEVAGSLEECVAQDLVVLDCSGEEFGMAWVAYAPEFGCAAGSGGSTTVAQFTFRLDEVVEEEAQIRGLRLTPPMPAPTDQTLEFMTDAPVPFGELPLVLEWASVFTSMTFAGGLSFLDATPDDSVCSLEAIPEWEALGAGATLRGQVELGGGTISVLDGDGEPTAVVSPDFALRGCFHLPAESHVLELDE